MASEITEWFTRRLTLVIDNDQGAYNRVTAAAIEAITDDMGTGETTADEYRRMYDGRGGAAYERWEYELAVGARVVDIIEEWIEEGIPDGLVKLLVADAMPLSDDDQKISFGAHYLPGPDVMAAVLGDDE